MDAITDVALATECLLETGLVNEEQAKAMAELSAMIDKFNLKK